MAISSPGVRIDGPDCVVAKFGLLSVAEVEDRANDRHWSAGFYHDQISCEDLNSRALNCPPPAEPKVTDGSGLDFPESDPFTLIAPFKCSTAPLPLSQAWDYARDRLSRGEARSLERTFWTGQDEDGNPVRGTLGGNPDAVDVTPATGAVSITDGYAMLESWAGENMPCAPIIHGQRGIGVYLAERNLIKSEGDTLYSKGTGSRIVIGGGYLATGPGGVAADPGESWIFVSGGVKIVRGPVFYTPERGDESGAVDREINDITVFAERTYGTLTECGVAAVRVNLKSCCC